jgi:hypothetical protein
VFRCRFGGQQPRSRCVSTEIDAAGDTLRKAAAGGFGAGCIGLDLRRVIRPPTHIPASSAPRFHLPSQGCGHARGAEPASYSGNPGNGMDGDACPIAHMQAAKARVRTDFSVGLCLPDRLSFAHATDEAPSPSPHGEHQDPLRTPIRLPDCEGSLANTLSEETLSRTPSITRGSALSVEAAATRR